MVDRTHENTGAEAAPAASPPAGWVLYDGACGFCSTWVPRFEETLRRRGFAVAPLQADWVRERLGLSEHELLDDVRLLLPHGAVINGADVYRYCMRRIWWAWPLWLLSILPGCRALFDWSYRTFARNRYCAPSGSAADGSAHPRARTGGSARGG